MHCLFMILKPIKDSYSGGIIPRVFFYGVKDIPDELFEVAVVSRFRSFLGSNNIFKQFLNEF